MIKLENISFSYKNKLVLKDITEDFHAGEIVGLVAPNGTGKSTLLNVLMNYETPQKGQLIIDKKGTYKSARKQIKLYKKISMMPDQQDLYNHKTGLEHLMMYKKIWKSKIPVKELINELNMAHYINDLVGNYSLGMRQRLCFAMQIAADTKIMLMDEVMNGLDPTNVTLISTIMAKKRDEGKLIIIASHLLDNLEQYADRIFFLSNGQLELFFDRKIGTKDQTRYLKINEADCRFLSEDIIERGQLLAEGLFLLPLDNGDEKELFLNLPLEKMSSVTVSRLSLKEAYDIKFGLNKKD
ncbi:MULTISPECIES: ATP-binding cassette domain-containing protein [Vagococcus]|uniref:ABC transporter ATP-binding protein n=1 Tax=Vagococcus TaxID=2737 RepID=UPI000E4FD714|nr:MULTISPECIES: ATP-binding cassette domain-containing protein [Vagococcus]RHH67257.1 ATP-binding cassette domain-containing protein [Vagococcus sp. AM17-17]